MKKYGKNRDLPTLYERLIKAQYISRIGVWTYFPDKETFLISGFICDVLGIPREEEAFVSRKEMRKLLLHIGATEDMWKDFFGKNSFDFRIRVPGKSNMPRTYRIVSEFRDNHDDQNEQIEGTVTDITEYLRMETLLQENRKEMEATQRFARVGSFSWDIDSPKIRGSQMFCEMLGLAVDDSGMADLSEITASLDFIDGGDLQSLIQQGKETGDIFSTRVKFTLKDTKEEIYFGLKGHCFFLNNSPVRLDGTIHDITERYLNQQKLNKKNQVEALGQLIGGLAHDFNNTLAGIVGFTEFIEKEVSQLSNSICVDYCHAILKTCDKASLGVDRLLHFAGKKKMSRVMLKFHDILKTGKEILDEWDDFHLDLDLHLDAENDSVEGDDAALQNLVINLALNSAEAMSGSGEFSIITKNISLGPDSEEVTEGEISEGEYLRVEFLDKGRGIQQGDLEKIFDPFYTSKDIGVGIGLSSVRETVDFHQGKITVNSSPGKGTEIVILFPLMKLEKSTKLRLVNPEFSEKETQTVQSGTILVVEDEQLLRDIAGHILHNMGCQTIFAQNGREAIEVFLENRDQIDLVLLDVVMPEMNGKETLIRLREIDPNRKVIMVSGFTEDSSIEEFFDLGAVGFITKPYRRFEIEGMVSKFLS